jgi:glycosyltransferase 2 family protein
VSTTAAEAQILPPTRKRFTLATGAKVAVSVALIYLLLRRTELGDIRAAFQSARATPLVYAFGLTFVGYYLSVARWRVLLAAQGVRAPFFRLVRSHMSALFFNNLLPSTIGGDTIRAYDSWRLGTTRTAAVAVIVMDRLTGVVALLACALGALLVSGHMLGNRSWWLVVAALGGTALIAAVILTQPAWWVRWVPLRIRLNRRIRATVERIGIAFRAFSKSGGILAKAFSLSLLLQLNVIAFYALIGSAFGLAIPLLTYFLIIPLALTAMLIPISVNAIGIRENVFVYLLGLFGVAAPDAIAFAWAAFGIILIHGVMGGIVYATGR